MLAQVVKPEAMPLPAVESILVVDFVLMVPEHVIEKRQDLPHGNKLTRSSMSVKI